MTYKKLFFNKYFLIIFLSIISTQAQAGTSAREIIENLQSNVDPLFALMNVISALVGGAFMLKGLLMLKSLAMPLTQASRPGEIGGPLVYIVVGAILLSVTSAANIFSFSIFGEETSFVQLEEENKDNRGQTTFTDKINSASNELISYAPSGIEGQWQDIIDTIIYYIAFIGYISFIRGWIILAKAGQPGVQPGTLPKGLVHIIGGIAAINFLQVIEVLDNTILG